MSTSCPLCDRTSFRIFIPRFYHFKGQDFDLVRCEGCDLIRVNPIPADSVIKEMYGDHYFQHDWISGRCEGSYPEVFAKRIGEYEQMMKKIQSRNGMVKGILLEIGSAGGGFLDFAKKWGWEVEGLEISSWGIEHARDYYGIQVEQGDFVHAKLVPDRYQCVFLGDVFEHFSDPRLAIEKLNRSLKVGGCAVLLLPMYLSSWCFRLFRLFASFMKSIGLPREFRITVRMEPKDPAMNPPYHLFEYSPRTLSCLFEKYGFEKPDIQGILGIPEFLWHEKEKENIFQHAIRILLLAMFKAIQFSAEHFNFPIVRALVIAQKVRAI